MSPPDASSRSAVDADGPRGSTESAASRGDAGAEAERRRRPGARRIALIAAGVLLFVAISGVLAKLLTPDNAERDADLALIRAEVRGDAASMIRQLSGCSARPACVAQAEQNAANPRLRRSGSVKIVSLTSQTANAATGETGKTRLAWIVLGTLPVVQCVDVRRTGNALTGIEVKLLNLSAPISNEGDC